MTLQNKAKAIFETRRGIDSLEKRLANENSIFEELQKEISKDITHLLSLHTTIKPEILLFDDKLILKGVPNLTELELGKIRDYLELDTYTTNTAERKLSVEFYNEKEDLEEVDS